MELDFKMDFATENHVSAYNNPALENYECEGQMDIFDFLADIAKGNENGNNSRSEHVTEPR